MSESHEQFDYLCALEASGELSTDDRRRLLDHLKICSDCRQTLSEYSAWTEALLAKPGIHGRPPASNETIELSPEIIEERRFSRRWTPRNAWMAITPARAAIALFLLFAIVTVPFAIHRMTRGRRSNAPSSTAGSQSRPEQPLSGKSGGPEQKSNEATDAAQIAQLQKEIAALEAQLSHQQKRSAELDEIRDVMRNPNMRVIFLHGVNQDQGEPPTGVALYLPGKQLLLFVYDTPQLRRSAYSLYAWANTGTNQQPEALGRLRRESKTDHWWVLRVISPDLLARINRVFLTIELNGRTPVTPAGSPVLIMSLNKSSS